MIVKYIYLSLPFLLFFLNGRIAAALEFPSLSASDAIQFRNHFLGGRQWHSSNPPLQTSLQTEDDLSAMVLLPESEFLSVPQNFSSAKDFLNQLESLAQQSRPFDLYQNSKREKARPTAKEELERIFLRLGPELENVLTLVVLPGIFGAAIDVRIFEEIFAMKESKFRNYWSERVEQRKRENPQHSSLRDFRFDLDQLRNENVKIEDLFHFSSVQNSDGKVLYNLILFNLKFLALESVGKIEEIAVIYRRRLEKVFDILGFVPKNLTYVGYSRGAMLGLEMLSQPASPMISDPIRIKAMVSLSGNLYGSGLADQAINFNNLNPAPPAAIQLEALKNFIGQLKTTDETEGASPRLQIARVVLSNLTSVGYFIQELLESISPKSPHRNSTPLHTSNSVRIKAFLRERIEEARLGLNTFVLADLRVYFSKVLEALTENFHLDGLSSMTQYNLNIRRVRVLGQAILDAVSELSTESRLEWWKKHAVPSKGIVYYGIAGTMVDPHTPAATSEEVDFKRHYDQIHHHLPDYSQLLSSYRQLRDITGGVAVNDSQMVAHRTFFWPELHRLQTLNKNQDPITSKFLGIMGTHHWGLALKNVIPPQGALNFLMRILDYLKIPHSQQIAPSDPFDRNALVMAIAASVAQDISEPKGCQIMTCTDF